MDSVAFNLDGRRTSCTDAPAAWVDSDGDSCNFYTADLCLVADDYANAAGVTANQACCICEGGENFAVPGGETFTAVAVFVFEEGGLQQTRAVLSFSLTSPCFI